MYDIERKKLLKINTELTLYECKIKPGNDNLDCTKNLFFLAAYTLFNWQFLEIVEEHANQLLLFFKIFLRFFELKEE